jgi:membrane fusion protein, multidrug efflux system
VMAGDTGPLVTITQMQPIDVAFAVAERELPAIREAMRAGPLTVTARIRDDPGRAVEGTLTFVDSRIDTSTGTIALKATFPNADLRLWPGQFVNVVLHLETQADALVVSAAAIQVGQEGPYVFVLRPDNSVELRPIQVARNVGQVAVVAHGLAEGERVVVDGQLRLVAGAKVRIATEAPRPATGAPAS